MLRQATTPRTMITLLCTIALILTLTAFFSCYKLDPLSSESPVVSPSSGGVGDDVTTMTQLGSSDDGGWVLTTDFFEKSNAPIGEAKIVADADLVSFILGQDFKIPGTTQITLSNNAGVTVNVTEASETKYRVAVSNSAAPAMPPVWFLIDNLADGGALGKTSSTESQAQAQFVDPALFAGYVATHIILLFDPEGIIASLRECREEAIATCGSLNKVKNFYIVVTFSLREGLSINCYSDCIHDQGGWGF